MKKLISKILTKMFDRQYNKMPKSFWSDFGKVKLKEIGTVVGFILLLFLLIFLPATTILTSEKYWFTDSYDNAIKSPIITNTKFNSKKYRKLYTGKHVIYKLCKNNSKRSLRFTASMPSLMMKSWSNKHASGWQYIDTATLKPIESEIIIFTVQSWENLIMYIFIAFLINLVIWVICCILLYWLRCNYINLKESYKCKVHPKYTGKNKPIKSVIKKKGCTCMKIHNRVNKYKKKDSHSW